MAILPIKSMVAGFSATQGDLEARVRAIEQHLSDVIQQINAINTENRYYYNDLIVAYDAANPIPADPPLDDMIAWDDVIGRAKYAYNGTWKII